MLAWEFTMVDQEWDDIVEPPELGCYVYGMYMEGAGFDNKKKVMCESKEKEIFMKFPVVHVTTYKEEATWNQEERKAEFFQCPMYRTIDRRGVLMTTGHSTNFIMYVYCACDLSYAKPTHWTKRGTALFCALAY